MDISESARRVVERLNAVGLRVVLAESCTGGLVAAELAKVPGVSNWLCGSAVTYRSETKVAWLDVDADLIETFTAVSKQVATQMVSGVLDRTPEANLAAAITGHLGPEAPTGFDGLVFIGVGRRDADPMVSRHQLSTGSRIERQAEAAQLVLDSLFEAIDR